MSKMTKAVAAAVLAMGASAAQAGIVIPAGDWTIDVNGNVNAYAIHNSSDKVNANREAINGGLANTTAAGTSSSRSSINTGLLPSWLGFTGKTRQNDLDISWTISVQPGVSATNSLSGGSTGFEKRQAFLTFGDKSWGTVKAGLDLGIFGSDAILNDMTLLGVGSQGVVGAAGGTSTTLGRIGTGYVYADWKGQISYASPNWNGFSFNVGIMQPWTATSSGNSGTTTATNNNYGFEGKASYEWGGDVSGKVWVGGIQQDVDDTRVAGVSNSFNAHGWEIGGKIAVAGFEAVGYYYDGKGLGTTAFLRDAIDTAGKERDSDGGYVQATYKLPSVGTKLGVSWGISNLDATRTDKAGNAGLGKNLVDNNEMWTVGVYHPLTKSLNLVAEYSDVQSENHHKTMKDNQSDIFSVGAILFF